MAEQDSKHDWIKTTPKELEKLILEIAKEEKDPSKIGLILRDKHGIPRAKIVGKKISSILKENKIESTPKKTILKNKIREIKLHLEKNKHDYSAKKSLAKNLWILNKVESREK